MVVAEPAKLLLVDASPGHRAVLQRILTAKGFSVSVFAGLQSASVALHRQCFEHAILDLRSGDRDGLEFVRSLRKARPHARIIVVTDADSFATVVLALRAGADGLVPKPVEEVELIDALFDRAPPLPPVPQTPLGLHRICWEHVMRVYEQCDRNTTRAAARLGMHRRSLQRFLAKRAPPSRARSAFQE
jgi:two-component system, response regulator RegA